MKAELNNLVAALATCARATPPSEAPAAEVVGQDSEGVDGTEGPAWKKLKAGASDDEEEAKRTLLELNGEDDVEMGEEDATGLKAELEQARQELEQARQELADAKQKLAEERELKEEAQKELTEAKESLRMTQADFEALWLRRNEFAANYKQEKAAERMVALKEKDARIDALLAELDKAHAGGGDKGDEAVKRIAELQEQSLQLVAKVGKQAEHIKTLQGLLAQPAAASDATDELRAAKLEEERENLDAKRELAQERELREKAEEELKQAKGQVRELEIDLHMMKGPEQNHLRAHREVRALSEENAELHSTNKDLRRYADESRAKYEELRCRLELQVNVLHEELAEKGETPMERILELQQQRDQLVAQVKSQADQIKGFQEYISGGTAEDEGLAPCAP